MKKFEAEWTGSYPNLCSGVWKLYVDGKDKSDLIPEDLRNYPMDTAGMYQTWHFEDWQEVFEDCEDGLECDDWIKENDSWISGIADCYDEKWHCLKHFKPKIFAHVVAVDVSKIFSNNPLTLSFFCVNIIISKERRVK